MVRGSHALETLLAQVNAKFPGRNKASDGGIGDAAHSARVSDHNPDANGIYHARDFTIDPARGFDGERFKLELSRSGDERLKYVIHNRRIWEPGIGDQAYNGSNPHHVHVHVSVYGDNGRAWNIPILGGGGPAPVPNGPPGLSIVKIKELQRVLNAWYPKSVHLVVDGDYGVMTTNAVKFAQRDLGLVVDGIAGPVTCRKLGIVIV